MKSSLKGEPSFFPKMPRHQKRTVCLINLGCAKNTVDSEVVLGILAEAGYIPYPDPEQAHIILINTCGFIEPARRESQRAIRRAVQYKKNHPSKVIGVIGCYVEKERDFLRQKFPQVDLWLGVKELASIKPALEGKSWFPAQATFLYHDKLPRLVSTSSVWAYIKISEGCSHACSFCTIPQIKGPYRSRSINSIVREAKQLAEAGVKEINLISQDTTYFGRDKGKEKQLARLLKELTKIPGVAWIRWLYGFPEEVDQPLLEVMREEKICPYFDLPFQHSHPKILRLMKRRGHRDSALKLMDKIRRTLPEAAIRTSLIVGFPGEGEAEFKDLCRFVQEAEFDHLGVFLYSAEPGTKAFSLGDPVPMSEKKRRQEEIMRLQAKISRRRLKRFVGQKLPVLLEGTSNPQKTIFFGRTRFQAPEVDGQVKVIWREREKTPAPAPGLGLVEIYQADEYDLRGIWLG